MSENFRAFRIQAREYVLKPKLAFLVIALTIVTSCTTQPRGGREDFSDELTDDQVVENFLRIAFGNEISPQAEISNRLIKWDGPLKVVLLDGINPDRKEVIVTHLSKLSEITGIPISYTRSQPNADLAIRVNSTAQIIDDIRAMRSDPSMSDGEIESFEFLEWRLMEYESLGRYDEQCMFLLGDFHQYWKGYVAIRNGLSEAAFKACAVENITHVLGLRSNHPDVKPSIFNDRYRYPDLTRQDVWLLRLLYDPELESGMTRQEARAIAKMRIAAHRNQTPAGKVTNP